MICGNVYITEVDWAGRENLIPSPQDDPARDDAGPSTQPQAVTSQHSAQLPPTQHQTQFSSPFHRDLQEPPSHSASEPSARPALVPNPTVQKLPSTAGKASSWPPKQAISAASVAVPLEGTVLDGTSQALYASLKSLTERLNALASNPLTDPASIGTTAEAITKVTQALVCLRNVQ